MKKFANFIDKYFGTVKKLAATFAIFATVFAFATSDGLYEFLTAYYAGGVSAVAMLVVIDKEDD